MYRLRFWTDKLNEILLHPLEVQKFFHLQEPTRHRTLSAYVPELDIQ